MRSLNESVLKFIEDFFESEKHRLTNLIPVGIGIGVCLYFSLNNEPNFYFSISVFIFSLTIWIITKFLLIKNDNMSTVLVYVFFSAFLAISTGFLVSQIRTMHMNTYMISKNIEKPISFIATIESCEKTDKGLKFIVSGAKRKYNDSANELCKKINGLHLIWIGSKARENQQGYVPGSAVLFRAILSPIYSQSFPGAYDFKKQQYFKGISARGFVIKPPKVIKEHSSFSINVYTQKLRHKINKVIEKYLPKDTAAIAEALTTGNTAGISKKVRSNFANSGIAHILAISGLHMGIIGFFIFWLARIVLCCFLRISMFYDVKKIAAVISWFITLFYLYISGFSVSSVRAFIMHTLIISAILLDRTAFTMRSVAIAATGIMLFTPEAVLFPSFQMSFGAVIAIVAFYECNWKLPKFLRGFSEIILTTVVASIPTSIISVFVFNQLTLNSILANIISIPLVSFFIMPIAMIALFFMLFGLAKIPFLLMGFGVDLLMKIAEETSRLPGSFFVMHSPTSVVIGCIIFPGLFFMLIKHRIRFFGLICSFFGLIYYFFQPIPDLFIASHGKVIGIKTDNAACFSNLSYFRSITASWAKSIGFEKRENFNSKSCRKYVSRIDDDTYIANIKNKKIVITSDEEYEKSIDDFAVFHLNKEKNKCAKLLYLDSGEMFSTEKTHRPWS